jgi:hypothetical protein
VAHTDPFLLGPLGHLVRLPSPVAAGFDAQYERTAAVQSTLTGSTTVDLLGVHRVWPFEMDWKDAADARRLIARWTSPLLSAPLRLVDPLTPNRLSLDAASGGGVSGSDEALTLTGATGQLRRLLLDEVPDELLGLLDGGYRAALVAGAAGDLLLDPQQPAPVVAGDEVLALRLWVRGLSATASGLVQWVDGAGTRTDLVGPPVALSEAAGWQLVELSGTPPAGTVGAVAGVRVTAAAGSDGQVDLTGAALAREQLDEWEPGGGAPVVVLDEFDHAYRRLGRRGMSLTVREV